MLVIYYYNIVNINTSNVLPIIVLPFMNSIVLEAHSLEHILRNRNLYLNNEMCYDLIRLITYVHKYIYIYIYNITYIHKLSKKYASMQLPNLQKISVRRSSSKEVGLDTTKRRHSTSALEATRGNISGIGNVSHHRVIP